MKMKKLGILLISVTLCCFQNFAQSERLPDLTFEAKVEGSTKNEPIELKIIVKNIGKADSEPAELSVIGNHNCFSKTELETLKEIQGDGWFTAYAIIKNIPALQPNETKLFTIKTEVHYTNSCQFRIVIDADNQLKEQNEKNNQTVFPAEAATDLGILPDLIVNKIHQPEWNDAIESTILTIDIENIGLATAENVVLNAWEITAVLPDVSDRDLKAIFGENWWLFQDEKTYEPMFDISKTLGNIPAGETVSVTLTFKGWIYNPDCKVGATVETTSDELTKDNNSASFLAGG